MLAPIVVAAVVAAQPAPVRLALPGLTYVNVDEKVGNLISEYFARQLEAEGVEVTTAQEVAAVIGLERQKQLLGCADESSTSCLAELAGALGMDGIITGSIGKIGTGYTLALKVVNSRDGSALASYSGRVATDDDAIDWMGQAARSLARELLPEEKVTVRQRAWIPAVAGGALLLGGRGAFLRASQRGAGCGR